MEEWLFLGILAYLSYALSTSIDKYLMNNDGDALATNTIKSLMDGFILLFFALIMSVSIGKQIVLYSLALGGIYAASGILYFKVLQEMNAGVYIPVKQSASVMLVFLLSVILLSEGANIFNLLGAFVISISTLLILGNGFTPPKLDRGLKLLLLSLCFSITYAILSKVLLADFSALALGSTMYFSASLFQSLYYFFSQDISGLKKSMSPRFLSKIGLAAVFGAGGTFLLYSALKLGEASAVYPLQGIQSVAIFVIGSLLLNEDSSRKKVLGVLLAFAGIFLVSI